MTESQWGGLCYILAAVLGLIYWRLQVEVELRTRDRQEDDDES